MRLGDAVESLSRATNWLLANIEKEPDAALAGASPYLRLFGIATGGCLLAKEALAAMRLGGDAAARLAVTRFFAENIAVQAGALERTVVEGAAGVLRRRCGACVAKRGQMSGFRNGSTRLTLL